MEERGGRGMMRQSERVYMVGGEGEMERGWRARKKETEGRERRRVGRARMGESGE